VTLLTKQNRQLHSHKQSSLFFGRGHVNRNKSIIFLEKLGILLYLKIVKLPTNLITAKQAGYLRGSGFL
jgi:hypothetical protein